MLQLALIIYLSNSPLSHFLLGLYGVLECTASMQGFVGKELSYASQPPTILLLFSLLIYSPHTTMFVIYHLLTTGLLLLPLLPPHIYPGQSWKKPIRYFIQDSLRLTLALSKRVCTIPWWVRGKIHALALQPDPRG